VANVKPGRVMFEMSFPNEAIARRHFVAPSTSCR